MDDDTGMKLWKVDDGEIHMVIAKDSDDALRLVAEGLGVTLSELLDSTPEVELADYTKACVVRYDSEVDAVAEAKRATGAKVLIQVEFPPKCWRGMKPGLLSSTCY